jgi:hypothetical protein
VIAQGHGIHTQFFGQPVQIPGPAETFRRSDLLQNPLGGPLGCVGVKMKIDFHGDILLFMSGLSCKQRARFKRAGRLAADL